MRIPIMIYVIMITTNTIYDIDHDNLTTIPITLNDGEIF